MIPCRGSPGFSRLDPIKALAYFRLMAVHPILIAPDPRLKAVSAPVEKVDDSIRRLAEDMVESMYEAEGIGLAAVQIGMPKRVIVMDLAQKDGRKEPRVFINPKLLWVSEENAICQEGCLSVPDIWEDVERPAQIRAEYLDLDGAKISLEAEGLLATCLQHEMDHLQGVLFVDHISRLKRAMAMKKLAKARRLADAV
jgi:peptide deformylase